MTATENTARELPLDAAIDAAAGQRPRRFSHPLWICLGLLLVAFNLRPALSSLAPVLPEVRQHFDISTTLAGLLTTLPVLCLGLFGPLAPRLARRFGAEALILALLGVLAAGIALRGTGSLSGLLVGTVLVGAGIGIVNVLLPGLVKRDFPGHLGLMTGLYTMVLCLGAAVAAGTTVPLEHGLGHGWQGALAFWALPVLLAMAAWAPQAHLRHGAAGAAGRGNARGLWRDPLAWQVAGFMGLQSSLAYIVMGWLPVILRDQGMDAVAAGLMTSISVMIQMITALLVPMLAARMQRQRLLGLVVMAAAVVGMLGLFLTPVALTPLFAAVLGLGQGGSFALGLTLIVLRARDPHVAAHLSGMSQSIGYGIAALGPLGVGLLRDLTGSFALPVAYYVLLGLGAAACAWGAGRAGHVLSRG